MYFANLAVFVVLLISFVYSFPSSSYRFSSVDDDDLLTRDYFPSQIDLFSSNLKRSLTVPTTDSKSPSALLNNLNSLTDTTRLSPSLKILVETNPFARAWLTMLLQKLMDEQPAPYIFKYGRRRRR